MQDTDIAQLHSSMSKTTWSTECAETDHDHAAESTTPLQAGSSDMAFCVAVVMHGNLNHRYSNNSTTHFKAVDTHEVLKSCVCVC